MLRWARLGALLLVLLLTGCAGTSTVEDLLRAPQLSTQLAVVQKALNAWLGESPQLKYPRSGDTSSPFLFSDLDGDGDEEAVVLYQSETSSLNVHLAVLEQQGLSIPGVTGLIHAIPGYAAGFGWLLPTVLGAGIGVLCSVMRRIDSCP